MEKELSPTEFRKELVKIMPGYKWTVHRNGGLDGCYLSATGIQTSGFNRLSTLRVERWKHSEDDSIRYEVKSSGFGLRAPWLSECEAATLARALRGLQEHYEAIASNYSSHARALEAGRRNKVDD